MIVGGTCKCSFFVDYPGGTYGLISIIIIKLIKCDECHYSYLLP